MTDVTLRGSSLDYAQTSKEQVMRTRPTVLCIDDYLPGLEIRKLILERHGYNALVACTGKHALTLARHSPVDVVLLDYKMPGMDGHELAHRLRRIHPRARIVLLSDSPAAGISKELFADVDAYIFKAAPPSHWLREVGLLVDDARRVA